MIRLSEQEREILNLGIEFSKLENSPAYKQIISDMDGWVEESKSEHEDALRKAQFKDPPLIAGIRYIERRDFRNLIRDKVHGIVEQAKSLSKQLQEEQQNEHTGITSDDLAGSRQST